MDFKKIILSDASAEAKVSAIALLLDKELPKLVDKVETVKKLKGEQGDRGRQGDKGDAGKNGKDSKNVTVISNSRITFTEIGKYNIQWSGQFKNTDTQEHDVSIWLSYNGVNVAGSTGLVGVPSSHGGSFGHTIAAWNYIIDVAKNGDYYEFYWSTASTQVTIATIAAQINPTRPSTASVIITANHIGF